MRIDPIKRAGLSWQRFFFIWVIFISACTSPMIPYPGPETPLPQALTPTISPSISAPARLTQTNTPAPSMTATPGSQLGLHPDSLKGTIVRFWHTWSGPAGEVLQKLVEQFNTTNEWKILVSPVQVGGLDVMDAQVNLVLEGTTDRPAPEIVMGYLYQLISWDQQRSLVDWEDYVSDPQWGLTSQEQADFYPAFWSHDLSAGRRLGFPAFRSAQLLYYNRAWARSLGYLEPPATVREFRRQACATAAINRQDDDRANDGTGGWMISTDYHVMYSWLSVYNSHVISDSVTGAKSPYNFASAETRAAFTYLRELYDQGCAWLPEHDYPELEFTNRLGLFSTGSLLDIPYQQQAFAAAAYQDDWTVIPFPSAKGKPIITVYGPSYGLLPSSPERQLAAWLFVKWLSEPKQQAQLVEASGAFPLRRSTMAELSGYAKDHPQWASAVDLLAVAQPEPGLQSWSTVRWALSDAGTQLYRYYFTADQIPWLADYLFLTAAELHQGFLPPTPTSAASPTRTATRTPTVKLDGSITPVPSLTPIRSLVP